MWYMNEERELLQGAFREFAQTRVRPFVPEMEEKEADCKSLIKEMGELGFLGLNMPEELGGSGVDYINEALLLEELAKESYVVSFSAMLVHMFNEIMRRGCSEEQMQKYLVPCVNGELLMGLAGNEALGGSFLEGFSTKAVKDGDTWTINGTKVLVSQSDVADTFMIMALSENGFDLFFASEGQEGLTHGHIENKLGFKGSRTGTVYFNDLKVSEADRFPNPYCMSPDLYGGFYGAMDLGGAEAVLDKTVNYLKQRIQEEGKSVWDLHESTRNDLARLQAKINNFRNSVYGHMLNLNNGDVDINESISLKIEGEKLLEEVSSECMSLMGGAGLIYETGIERFYRDVKMTAHACCSNKTFLSTIASTL